MVPELRAERLRLRALERADTEAVVRVFADPAMSRFFQSDLSDLAQCLEMMRRRLSYDGPPELGHWAIELNGSVIGVAHLRPSWELPGEVAEIGWAVGSAHGGRGLATEAARRLIDYGFGELGLPAIWALVRADNTASMKLARRTGFLDVGETVAYGTPHRVHVALPGVHGRPHHIELWVADLAAAERGFGWLLGELGWREYQRWPAGVSWKLGTSYLVVERSPALTGERHERCRPGLNHLAFHVSSPERVDELAERAENHGWKPLFADRYPHAGGDHHYAAYLEDENGFEVELVALPTASTHKG